MKNYNNICIGLIGGFLISYGYMSEYEILMIFGVLILAGIFISILKMELGVSHTINKSNPNITPNIRVWIGEPLSKIVLEFRENDNIICRLKWRIFCIMFPIKYKWIKGDDYVIL